MSATAAPDPIPVRALNQVTYCPRLYYLTYVDAVMPANEQVEGGLFDHRRVDAPDLKHKTRTDRGTATSRGVDLSSAALGISGVLDVVEERAGEQYPIETKHGVGPAGAARVPVPRRQPRAGGRRVHRSGSAGWPGRSRTSAIANSCPCY